MKAGNLILPAGQNDPLFYLQTLILEKLQLKKYYKQALWLSVITVVYNIAEGLFSVYFGLTDETLALFGFGLDSFIETISAIGITIMILRISKNDDSVKSEFEVIALKITGWCFYGLSFILLVSGIFNIIKGQKPETTLPGVIITLISIISMLLLIQAKRNTGRKLNSAPILADANCNVVCVYMSVVVLVSSALYEIFKIGWFDLLGTAGIIYFSFKEGFEAFEKAKSNGTCSV